MSGAESMDKEGRGFTTNQRFNERFEHTFLEKVPSSGIVRERLKSLPNPFDKQNLEVLLKEMVLAVESAQNRKSFDLDILRESLSQIVKDINEIPPDESMLKLIDIKDYDDYIFVHPVNVCILSILIGKEAKLKKAQLEELGMGALFHDIGRVRISEDILKKESHLTPEEFEAVKRHPVEGLEILLTFTKRIEEITRMVITQHHERYNGEGYPWGFSGNQISYFALIAAVADTYDALTTRRPYCRSFSPYEAVRRIATTTPSDFDPHVTRLFINTFSVYPPGCLVRLNTKETAIVIRTNKESVLRPIVRLILDKNGDPLKEDIDINLLKEKKQFVLKVLEDLTEERQNKNYT
jgi:HD-GYP domain-containing protein (c-di-GMP phosphodiesterase class II)